MKEFYFIATDNLKLKDFKIKYLMHAKNVCNVKYDQFFGGNKFKAVFKNDLYEFYIVKKITYVSNSCKLIQL